MKLEPERSDRSYLYGRLLAVADKIESHAMFKQGKEKIRPEQLTLFVTCRHLLSAFRTWKTLFTQQLNPTFNADGANWYLNIIQEIMSLFNQAI